MAPRKDLRTRKVSRQSKLWIGAPVKINTYITKTNIIDTHSNGSPHFNCPYDASRSAACWSFVWELFRGWPLFITSQQSHQIHSLQPWSVLAYKFLLNTLFSQYSFTCILSELGDCVRFQYHSRTTQAFSQFRSIAYINGKHFYLHSQCSPETLQSSHSSSSQYRGRISKRLYRRFRKIAKREQ